MRPRRPLTAARFAGVLAALGALLLATGGMALGFGSADLSWGEVWTALRGGGDAVRATILADIRLPRVALAALAGIALAAAGAAYQAVLRNPLAEPYILGVSGGAALGAIAAETLGLGAIAGEVGARPLGAFAGALCTIALLFRVATLRGRAWSYSLILVGVVINSFFSALILFVVTVADFTRFQGVLFWLAGSVSSPPYGVLGPLAALVAGGVVTLAAMGASLNLLSQGEATAAQLGLHVARTRLLAIVVASLTTAAVVSFAGLIGFVGLMVPHMARLVLGPDHRLLVPAAALAGGAFLVAADTLARTAFAPTEIPVGIVTAILGGPFFLWLYRAQGGGSYFE
jgi:iron complex transport system permease protein